MPFSEVAANRAVNFIEKTCYLSKGDAAGQLLKLQDWQKNDIIRPLFGTLNEDGTRQYKTAFIFLPRKNAKSTLAAAISNYMLYGDGEAGGEVVLGAASRDQATIVFNHAAGMVRQSPTLNRRSQIIPSTKRIIDKVSMNVLRAISSDAPRQMGLDPSCVIIDELAWHQSRELYDTLVTSMRNSQPCWTASTRSGTKSGWSAVSV